MDSNQYYQNLLQQGHSQVDAAHFTSQYYPGFQPPMQGAGMMTPQATGMEMGAMEFGGIASSGMGAPAGFGAGMGAGGIGAGGMAAGAGMAATGTAVGGGLSFATIAVVSVLVLGGAGTAGYFIYDSLSETEETKPEFYGTVYWMDYSFGWQFEDDELKIVVPANSSNDCDVLGEEISSMGGEYKDGLCYIDPDYFSYTSENKGDYYEICVTDGGEEDCSEVYVLDRGAVFYADGMCNAMVSGISTPTYNASSDEAGEWVDEFIEISDELEDEICGDLAQDSTTGGLTMYSFEARDGSGDVSDSGGDSLVHIKMTSGEPISWSELEVRITVDGGSSIQCDEYGRNENYSDCVYYIDSNDYAWDVAEEITISEGNNVDLCGGVCEIRVTIIKIGVGNEEGRIIGDIIAYVES